MSATVDTDRAITVGFSNAIFASGSDRLTCGRIGDHLGQAQDAARDRYARRDAGAHGLPAGGDADRAVGGPHRGRPVGGAVHEQAVAEGHAPESEGLICHALTVARACDHAVMADLFDNAAADALQASAPLADRVRPAGLDGFVGQAHLIGPGTALRRAIEEDRVPSAIFHGAPGTGKTTLARIIAHATGSEFEELSAVQVGKADVTAVIGRARERLGGHGRRTILFLDEIHRFNKAQQDALLPVVESGLITLIGATTENPYFEINSRAAVAVRAVRVPAAHARRSHPAGRARRRRPARRPGRGHGGRHRRGVGRRRPGGARDAGAGLVDGPLARRAGGAGGGDRGGDEAPGALRPRRRRALRRGLGLHQEHARQRPGRGHLLAGGHDRGRRGPEVHRAAGDLFASEDVGNADPRALEVAIAAARAVEFVGLPEARINLAQAVAYVALAPKSNASIRAIDAALAEVRRSGNLTPPSPIRDGHYPGAKAMGRGNGYVYPHCHGGFEPTQRYLPEELGERASTSRAERLRGAPDGAARRSAAPARRGGRLEGRRQRDPGQARRV